MKKDKIKTCSYLVAKTKKDKEGRYDQGSTLHILPMTQRYDRTREIVTEATRAKALMPTLSAALMQCFIAPRDRVPLKVQRLSSHLTQRRGMIFFFTTSGIDTHVAFTPFLSML